MMVTGTRYLIRPTLEVAARIRTIESDGSDPFGWRRETLVSTLPYSQALPFLAEPPTPTIWEEERVVDVAAEARAYLRFAIDKISNHRGISAGRSVDKLAEYAWLLGQEHIVDDMIAAEYPQYGAPKIRAFALGMGWPWPDDEWLRRMVDGAPCRPDCQEGCRL
jgi:hypothetical protein